ncbi:hypothetical protein HCU64_06715 [Methylobacterium sp. C25]|uniref:hypothetical protein n=1 Tax=Methylobacterium sp. C25 TaxID=2721622 RepID=UPI001F413C49|nr:hypothetical protein [Methylobacterium sp. C25]MCE4223438.1 hypothetical protein [Methylobacterium sp. C25]
MSFQVSTIRAAFTLRLRCHHCLKITCRELISPDVEDAPSDIDELLGSAWLSRQTFACGECENPIATLVSIQKDEPPLVIQ